MERCGNGICSHTDGCILRDAINAPQSLRDLRDQWKTFSPDCVNTEELRPEFEQKEANMAASESSEG